MVVDASSDSRFAARVRVVLADQLYATGIPMLLTSMGAATLLGVSVWLATGSHRAWIWIALVYAVGLPRFSLVRGYQRARDRDAPTAWQRRFAIHAGTYGLAWGQSGVLLVGDDAIIDQVVMLGLAFKVLGGFQAFYAHKPAFYAFSLALVLPPAGRMLWVGDTVARAQAATTVLFMLGSWLMMRRFHVLLIESIEGRLKNAELADQAARERDRALDAQRMAEEATRSKSHFLAAASHDLRQPLYAQSLFVDALCHELPDGHGRYLARRIATTSDALRGLLDGMLDVSKLDAGVIRLELRPFPLQPVIDEIARELEPLAAARGLRLRVPETSLAVISDRTATLRIIRNLATNAVQHTSRGGVLIGARRGDPVRIVIVDTGLGIEPADQERIFHEFVQLGNPERDRARGVGLGLSIVRRLARLLGTEVRVRSVVGRGSQFWIELPLATAVEQATPTPAVGHSPSALAGRRVLVVDDEADVRDGMAALLGAWGCNVTTAESGDGAIASLAGTVPDVIVADYLLRDGETGVGVIERVRHACERSIPAVLITGETRADRLRAVMESGLRVLNKPASAETLQAVLGDLIAGD